MASSLLTNSTNPNPLFKGVKTLKLVLPVTLGVDLLRESDFLDSTIGLEELSEFILSRFEGEILDDKFAGLKILIFWLNHG